MILKDKNAIVYGAGGSLGSEISKAFAKAGARVFLTGRNIGSVQMVADEINGSGGRADVRQVDALDENDIRSNMDQLVAEAGVLDISFSAVGLEDVQNIALVDMAVADFVRPVILAMQSQFLTASAAGKVMRRQKSGVVLSLSATPGAIGYPLVGGFGPACAAMESLSRGLASELGVYGVRVVNIRSGGSPDSRPFKEAIVANPEAMKVILGKMEDDTMLKRLPLMADIANMAVFLSSDLAHAITGVTIDATGGTTTGLNYRMTPIPFE